MPMIWIECDCCGNTHLCETCFMAIRAAEVVKHG